MSTGTVEMIDRSLDEDGNFEEVRWSKLALDHGKEVFSREKNLKTCRTRLCDRREWEFTFLVVIVFWRENIWSCAQIEASFGQT